METRKLLTVAELAPRLQVGVPRLYEMARRGMVPSIRIGRQLRFDLSQIERWIEDGGSADMSNQRGGHDA